MNARRDSLNTLNGIKTSYTTKNINNITFWKTAEMIMSFIYFRSPDVYTSTKTIVF